jgi:hypothetical protein
MNKLELASHILLKIASQSPRYWEYENLLNEVKEETKSEQTEVDAAYRILSDKNIVDTFGKSIALTGYGFYFKEKGGFKGERRSEIRQCITFWTTLLVAIITTLTFCLLILQNN